MKCTKFLLELDQMQGVMNRAWSGIDTAYPTTKDAMVGNIKTDINHPCAVRLPKFKKASKDSVWLLNVFDKQAFMHYVGLVYRHDTKTLDWVDSVGVTKSSSRRRTAHQYEDPVFRKWYAAINKKIACVCSRDGIKYNGYKHTPYRPQLLEMGLSAKSVTVHSYAPGKCYLWTWHITEGMLRDRLSFDQWLDAYIDKVGKKHDATRKFIKNLVYRIYAKISVPMMDIHGCC